MKNEHTPNPENPETFRIGEYDLSISREHRFGTDALCLAQFSLPAFGRFPPGFRAADLCTGCGIVPVVIASAVARFPERYFAADISPDATELLAETISGNKDTVLNNIVPLCRDLRDLAALGTEIPAESCGLVTVNPPYFPGNSGAVRGSKREAAARHEVECRFPDVARAAAFLLKYGGELKLCHRPERLAEVTAALKQHSLEPKELTFLTNHNAKTPWLFLMKAKKGGKPGLTITTEDTEVYLGGNFISCRHADR
ncbi:SAM-dependent methyltransferase [Clostridia bacterium]|nr:SAM-dependent methyltransferase [Clostridia bacterium]